MSDETLKPCPFCGGEIPAPTRRYMSVLICPTCNAYGPGNSDMTNDKLIAAWNTRATHGTLTAEQVMAIAGKHQPDYCSDTHVCFDWQAIADELTAKLGSGTCELVETYSYSNSREVVHVLECSACGKSCEHVNGNYPRCPHCGAKAVEQ